MTTDEFVRQHADADVRRLALQGVPEGVDLRRALVQIEGRQLATRKLPDWAVVDGLLWPERLALEQCSSQWTAHYKQRLVQRLLHDDGHQRGKRFADLTAGLGVDFVAMASLFDQAFYAERREELCALARHNLPLLGVANTTFHCGDGLDLLTTCELPFDLIFLDPARRDAAGRKVALIEDCTPDVCALQHQLRRHARHLLIKLSPMLDITAALRSLRGVTEVHVVAVHGECKEVLLVLDGLTEDGAVHDNLLDPDDVPITCMDIIPHSSFSSPLVFTRRDEEQAPLLIAPQLEEYVYEPQAAILKAGAFKTVAVRYGLRKLASQSHLYTSAHLCSDFSGRCWHVEAWSTFGKRDLRHLLSDIKGAELTVRGFPLSADALRRQLRLRQGSDAHLLATTLADGTKVLIRCARL